MILFFLIGLLTIQQTISLDKICTKTNCVLPCCQCPATETNPTDLKIDEVPQLVLLTFIGNINGEVLDPIRQILDPSHRNPNKCPISATFFVNDNHTDYCLVQRLFDNQNEIAMTTSSNRCPLTNCYDENHWRPWIENDWQREIKQQRLNIFEKSRIHRSHIKGFRVPHLQIDQYRHLELIRNLHFSYDSSILFKSSSLVWPFTMSASWPSENCVNCQDAAPIVEGFWQIPLHELIFPNETRSCRTISDLSCLPDDREHSSEVFFELLKFNFDRHLGERSPFVIELDLTWLNDDKENRLDGLIRFIEHILNSPDLRFVYFVSIGQALEWLKYPRSVKQLDDFWSFSCSNTIYEYDIDCLPIDSKKETIILPNGERIERLKTENQTDESKISTDDRQAEELFRSDIVLHSIWVFLSLIIAVLFYDKYFSSK